MEVLIEVVNQKLRLASNLKSFAPHSQKFIKFRFELSSDWDELTILAQFRQNDVAYNVYLEGDNTVYLPNEIKEGKCTLMLYGSKDTIIGTTNCLTLLINDNKFLTEAESTTMSQSLYDKLLAQIQVELDEAKNELTAQNVTEYNIAINNLTSENSTQLNNSIDELERSNAANIATTKTQLENQINTQISSATNSLSTQITSELNDAKEEILAMPLFTVTWYSLPDEPIYSTIVEQYKEAVYIGELPKNTTEECNEIYNIFVGWDKSTGCVTSDMDVYAVWERGIIADANSKQLKDMNCAELYGMCATDYLHFNVSPKDYIDVQLGHDFSFSNVTSYVLCENTFFDGTNAFLSTQTIPTDKSFTLAIDFELLSDTSNTYILDWYNTASNCSIRLKCDYAVSVQINGNSLLSVGYSKNRGIIVIRYNKYLKRFYVYYDNGFDYESYGFSIKTTEYSQGSKTITSTPMCFGGSRSTNGTSITSCAHGWIHWCKLWHDDLGENVCKTLATHPHTIMRMEYINEGRYVLDGTNGLTSGASFLSNNLLPLKYRMNDTDTNIGGWYDCEMRKFLNTRIYNAFSYKWQAIIKPVQIPSGEGQGSNFISKAHDYIYIPSCREVGGASTSVPYQSEGTPIGYLTDNNSRIKCLFIIENNAQFITSSVDPTESNPHGIAEGSIWIKSNVPYYYLSEKKHDVYGIITASDGGIWFPVAFWHLRSQHSANSVAYMIVQRYGGVSNSNSRATAKYNISIGFSV